MSPEAPKLDDAPSRKRVKITEAEKRLFKVADPNGPEIQAFLELNGLKFGDEIIADVEGQDEPEIFDLSEKDFFDTIHEDTERLDDPEKVPEVVRDELADASFELVGPEDPEETPTVQVKLADAPAPIARELVDGSDQASRTSEEFERFESYYGGRVAGVVVFAKNDTEARIGSLFDRSSEVDAVIDQIREVMIQAGELHRVGWGVDNNSMVKERAQETLDGIIRKLTEVHTGLREAGEVDAVEAEGVVSKLKTLLGETTAELRREDETAELALRDRFRDNPDFAQAREPQISSKATQQIFADAVKNLESQSGVARSTGDILALKAKELLDVVLSLQTMSEHARFGSLDPVRIYQLEETLKEIANPETIPEKIKGTADRQAEIIRKAITDAGALHGMKL